MTLSCHALTNSKLTFSAPDSALRLVSSPTFFENTTNDQDHSIYIEMQTLHCQHMVSRKQIYHWTWYSPSGKTKNTINCILISHKWKVSIISCQVLRCAQLGSTHYCLLIADLWLKIKAGRYGRSHFCFTLAAV